MRLAMELSHICAARFSRETSPVFLGFDDVHFRKPVPVGSIWSAIARVVHAAPDSLRIHVEAHNTDVETGDSDITNEFYFIYRPSEFCKDRTVIPRSYEEGMLSLEGRRRWANPIRHIDDHHQ